MITKLRSEQGFTLAEMLIATGLLLVISSIVTSALVQITNHQQTVWNRTEMHSGVRGATELLQQEVGQAGRIALPAAVTIESSPVPTTILPSDCDIHSTVLTSVAGMWFDAAGNTSVTITFLDGDNSESVKLTALNKATRTVTGCFWKPHAVGAPVTVLGVFANGVIPKTGILNGSTDNKLKMFGDINGDGNMVYIEYYCDNGDPGTDGTHNLYRNSMKFDWDLVVDGAKPTTLTNSKILLSNVYPNPPDVGGAATPCFQYQETPTPHTFQGTAFTMVLDVAVTLTVQTQVVDPITKRYQTETKALLNVSPRNVFFGWELVGMGYTDRLQSTPSTISALLP
jgi:prepilin-type N-terminal cleavage/methylation domain-containing protein